MESSFESTRLTLTPRFSAADTIAFSSQRMVSYSKAKDGVGLFAPVLFLQLGRPEREEGSGLLFDQFEGRPTFFAGNDLALDGVSRDRQLGVAFQTVHSARYVPS